MKERDMFEPVKKLLQSLGFPDVYGEVGLIDVVGVNPTHTVAVEMKTSLNIKVIEQAMRSHRKSHFCYIAVPKTKDYATWEKKAVFKKLELGLIYVDDKRAWVAIEPPKEPNKPKYDARKDIQAHHEFTVGGSKAGDTLTGYKYTMMQVKELLGNTSEPVTIDYIHENIKTHYYGKSAKRSLASAIKDFESADIEIVKVGRRNHYKLRGN